MGIWPWELLMAFAGHRVPHSSFYLSVHSIAGELLLTRDIMSNVTNGQGSVVWVAR